MQQTIKIFISSFCLAIISASSYSIKITPPVLVPSLGDVEDRVTDSYAPDGEEIDFIREVDWPFEDFEVNQTDVIVF